MELLAKVPVDELGSYLSAYEAYVPVEFNRRLINTNEELIQAIQAFKSASDRAARRLLAATVVLAVLTVGIVVLTGVLVWVE